MTSGGQLFAIWKLGTASSVTHAYLKPQIAKFIAFTLTGDKLSGTRFSADRGFAEVRLDLMAHPGRSISMTTFPRLKTLIVPVEAETVMAMESVTAVIPAAAAWRAPNPIGKSS